MDDGSGTPKARLTHLLEELAKRFPGTHCPIMSDPPEPKYLAAIDKLIEKCKPYKSPEQLDFENRMERIDKFLSEDIPSRIAGSGIDLSRDPDAPGCEWWRPTLSTTDPGSSEPK